MLDVLLIVHLNLGVNVYLIKQRSKESLIILSFSLSEHEKGTNHSCLGWI